MDRDNRIKHIFINHHWYHIKGPSYVQCLAHTKFSVSDKERIHNLAKELCNSTSKYSTFDFIQI